MASRRSDPPFRKVQAGPLGPKLYATAVRGADRFTTPAPRSDIAGWASISRLSGENSNDKEP